MQISANTTTFIDRMRHAFLPVFARRAVRAASASFSIYCPGYGTIGTYDTPEAAESALHYLPFSVRQQATICDADGYALCR